MIRGVYNKMKITFFSNFLNHHQLPLCMEFLKLTNNNFTFVATEPIPEDRLKLGYHDMNKKYDFVLTTYDDVSNEVKAMDLALNSDVIIIGSAPEKYVLERIKRKKITFRYSERLLKRGMIYAFSPRLILYMFLHHTRYCKYPMYMLCASSYTAKDYSYYGAYLNKTYKWGYFPEVKEYQIKDLMKKKESSYINILWVARFIPLKHPEAVLEVADYLRQKKYNFQIQMIGTGPIENDIKKLVKQRDLEKFIKIEGSMSPEKVREHMEKSNIFLFTSDYNEGWGAVLNESMNSGCAVIACRAIGSAKFLIKENYSGLLYDYGNQKQLNSLVEKLILDENLRVNLGVNAYNTIINEWSPKSAAERFIDLTNRLMQNKDTTYGNGPCSKA